MFDSYSSDQASDIDPRYLDALEARARDIQADDEQAEADAETAEGV